MQVTTHASVAIGCLVWEGDAANLRLVLLVLLSGDVNVVVAQGEKFGLHAIDRFQAVDLQSLHEIYIVPDDVLPEFGRQQRGSEDERLPVEVANLDLTRQHDLFQVDEANNDTLSGQLHLVHHVADEAHHVFDCRVHLLVGYLLKVEVEERHRRRVAMHRLDCPLVPHKVVLVEQLRALCRHWDQSLRLADVIDYDVAHVCVELLSCELELVIGAKLLPSELGEAGDFFLALVQEVASVARLLAVADRSSVGTRRCIGLIADIVDLLLLGASLLNLLSPGHRTHCRFVLSQSRYAQLA